MSLREEKQDREEKKAKKKEKKKEKKKREFVSLLTFCFMKQSLKTQ